MNRMIGMMAVLAGLAIGTQATLAAPPPPPPPGGGGGITPPDTPPPGKIYFEDNVVIVGPGFVKPDSGGGTVFITIPSTIPGGGTVKPGGGTDKTIENTVRQLLQVKSQVDAKAVAMPSGLLDPAALLMILFKDQIEEQGLVRDPSLLAEEASAAGASVKAAPDAPAPRQPKRCAPGAPVVPSYWQLPIP